MINSDQRDIIRCAIITTPQLEYAATRQALCWLLGHAGALEHRQVLYWGHREQATYANIIATDAAKLRSARDSFGLQMRSKGIVCGIDGFCEQTLPGLDEPAGFGIMITPEPLLWGRGNLGSWQGAKFTKMTPAIWREIEALQMPVMQTRQRAASLHPFI